MRLRGMVAAILALSIAAPSWAAWTKGINNSGPAIARPKFTTSTTNGVYAVNIGATSGTGAIWRVQSSLAVNQYNFSPTVACPAVGATNAIRGMQCDDTNCIVYGGGSGGWCNQYAAMPTFSSWTDITGASGTGADAAFVGNCDVFGARTWTCLIDNSTAGSVTVYPINTSGLGTGLSRTDSYTLREGASVKVNSNFHFGALITGASPLDVYTIAVDSANAKLWDGATSTGQFTGSWQAALARPGVTDGVLGVAIFYDSTNSQSVIVGQNSSGTKVVNAQVVTSTDLRPGFYFDLDGAGAALWAFDTAGVAYKLTNTSDGVTACSSSSAAGCTFVNVSGTTYDITLDGGDTLAGCSMGGDYDSLGAASDPFCTTANGDFFYVASAVSCSLSPSPTSIAVGASSTLTWSCTNGSSSANTWNSSVATSGADSVSPSSSTGYALRCKGAGGDAVCATQVKINASGGGGRQPPSLSGSL